MTDGVRPIVKIEFDEDNDSLSFQGQSFEIGDDGRFEVLRCSIRSALLSDLPHGCSVVLCDRVIGSSELFQNGPSCTFEHAEDHRLLAHGETVFLVDDDEEDVDPAGCQEFFAASIAKGKTALAPFAAEGTLVNVGESVDKEIAYLTYSLQLPDQTIREAEFFMAAVEDRIRDGMNRPLMFICHASEDKPFVEELVAALDRRALHAWFDKREILVGDSIVDQINEALAETRYVVPVLSSRSVSKPWVLRELNSSLMRQLSQEKISILPILLDDCDLPPLLADIKYADFRNSFEQGFSELLRAIQR
jgi:hypothetical protein